MCTRQELAEFWPVVAENRRARALGLTGPSLGRAKFLGSLGFILSGGHHARDHGRRPHSRYRYRVSSGRDRVETVQDRYQLRLDDVLYDATNCFTFFQPHTPAGVAQSGHNKAGHHDARQIGLAVATTRQDGLPLLSLVYQGNCHDAKLFPESMTRLIDRITHWNRGAHHLVVIGDRGNNSQKNFPDLVHASASDPAAAGERLRVDVIGGLVASQHRDLLQKNPYLHIVDAKSLIHVVERAVP